MIETEQFFKYRIRLSNTDEKTIHHEVKRAIKKALESSTLKYAQNKTWPKMFFGPGFEEVLKTNCEFVDICLLEKTNAEDIAHKLDAVLPSGLKVEEVKEIPYSFSSVEKLASYAAYLVTGLTQIDIEALQTKKLEVTFTHPNGMREAIDVRALICEVNRLAENQVEIIIKINPARSIGLKQMLAESLGLEGGGVNLKIVRSRLLWQDSLGNLKAV